MMPAAIEAWSDLFVASAGASAALAGLVFVAVSINIERILGLKGLPDLALVTLLLLLGVLIVSLFSLVPDQSEHALGTELLIQSAIWTAAIAWFAYRSLPDEYLMQRAIARFTVPALGTVPYLVGSVLLISGSEAGMYWIFAGLIGALIAAVMDAWVLLVEILR